MVAPGTILKHSGDSLNASSALHALVTKTPNHAPVFGAAVCRAFAALLRQIAKTVSNTRFIIGSISLEGCRETNFLGRHTWQIRVSNAPLANCSQRDPTALDSV